MMNDAATADAEQTGAGIVPQVFWRRKQIRTGMRKYSFFSPNPVVASLFFSFIACHVLKVESLWQIAGKRQTLKGKACTYTRERVYARRALLLALRPLFCLQSLNHFCCLYVPDAGKWRLRRLGLRRRQRESGTGKAAARACLLPPPSPRLATLPFPSSFLLSLTAKAVSLSPSPFLSPALAQSVIFFDVPINKQIGPYLRALLFFSCRKQLVAAPPLPSPLQSSATHDDEAAIPGTRGPMRFSAERDCGNDALRRRNVSALLSCAASRRLRLRLRLASRRRRLALLLTTAARFRRRFQDASLLPAAATAAARTTPGPTAGGDGGISRGSGATRRRLRLLLCLTIRNINRVRQ